MQRSIVRLAMFAVVAAPLTATAQSQQAVLSWGVIGGLNLATIKADDGTKEEMRAGIDAGAYLEKRVTDAWSFRAEAHYTQKGSEVSDAGVKQSIRLTYLEVPLLLKTSTSGSSSVRPFLEFGASAAFKLDCSATGVVGTAAMTIPCSDFADVRAFDAGALGGVGLEFPIGARSSTLSVRYSVGLLNLSDDGTSHNRNLQFLFGIRL